MSYEQHLDEVTTLITEKYDIADQPAIDMVMRAQADGYFSGHDDDPSICTQLRAEQDAALHFEGTGETAWGLKFVLVAVRSTDRHGRIILDTDWVPSPGGEAATALNSIGRIAADAPGLQGVIYDGALRGVHHQRLLRDLGLLPINKVTAAVGTGPNRKKSNKARVEKSTFVEQRTITEISAHPLLKPLTDFLSKNNLTLADMGMTNKVVDEEDIFPGHLGSSTAAPAISVDEYQRRKLEALEDLRNKVMRANASTAADPILLEHEAENAGAQARGAADVIDVQAVEKK